MTLRLTKHHGLANDFLVLLLDTGAPQPGPDLAIQLCDRHRGIGADGLLIGERLSGAGGEADLRMVLYNADGSRAEMSGNGIRCLAQAEARRRGTDDLDLAIETDGGRRSVEVRPDPDHADGTVMVRVEMGPARPGPEADWQPAEPPAVVAQKQATVDLGNPHLVLLVDDPAAVMVDREGPLHESCFDSGINVHFVAPTPGATDEVDMRVWERGAGITEACGTGATAAARVLHDWGLVGNTVTVHMPGGDVQVEVGESMTLIGSATHIADVEVDQ